MRGWIQISRSKYYTWRACEKWRWKWALLCTPNHQPKETITRSTIPARDVTRLTQLAPTTYKAAAVSNKKKTTKTGRPIGDFSPLLKCQLYSKLVSTSKVRLSRRDGE